MNIKELKIALNELGINPTEYSLEGGYLEGGWVINRHRHLFTKDRCDVYFCERGEVSYFAKNCTVEKACEIVYEHFKAYRKNSSVPPTREEDEETESFVDFINNVILHSKGLPSGITAVYLMYYNDGYDIRMKFSGSSKYGTVNGKWYWEEEFVPENLSRSFVSNVRSTRDAFFRRVLKHINIVLAYPWGKDYFDNILFFAGFEGETPYMYNPKDRSGSLMDFKY